MRAIALLDKMRCACLRTLSGQQTKLQCDTSRQEESIFRQPQRGRVVCLQQSIDAKLYISSIQIGRIIPNLAETYYLRVANYSHAAVTDCLGRLGRKLVASPDDLCNPASLQVREWTDVLTRQQINQIMR